MITDVQIVTMFNKPSDVSMKEIFADQPGDAEESHEKYVIPSKNLFLKKGKQNDQTEKI